MGKAVGLVITLLLLVATTGCMATFASQGVEQRFDLRGRPSLHVSVTSEMIQLNNADQRVPLLFAPDYSDDVIRALGACDCFSAVDTTPGSHDLEASIRVSRVVHNNSTLLNFVTAMIVPAVEDRQISIRVSARDRRSNAEATVQRIRDFRVWYQLFLLPVYPFASPAAFEMKLLSQLIREAVAEASSRARTAAAQQGAWTPPPS